ncbi:serine hydrolase domain-containing protein [Neobacillus cucumis]|uniref:serine hydrolase domain-containing protein n=1 Tax=Neobacillus cucumis TaxID=1740721 RepID=UPI001965D4E5|nr:serine hydrolase [Neobacillus cucumis]MBM7654631.1 CubicO group peptidase (beta-lactamase class C family) [Neobacillus cucumis]
MENNKYILNEKNYIPTYFSYMVRNKFTVAYNDYHFFSTKKLPLDNNPYSFKESPNKLKFSTLEYLHKGKKRIADFKQFMENTGTTALLIIKNDTIFYEGYFNGHKRNTPQKLFSITKSFISTLVGIAIDSGYIKSVDDFVSSYIPEIKLRNIRIKHLLQMDAGIKFKEGHFPWRDEAKVYLYPNARELALTVVEDTNDTFFHYNDYHLLILGLILERTTDKSVTDFFYEKIWSQLGMEFPGFMILDSEKHSFEKIESGLVMTAIDLAKFGSLYLNNGEWKGKQIISKDWIEESVSPNNVPTNVQHFRYYQNQPWGKMWFNQNKAYYKYLWWGHLNNNTNNDYFALGALGQVLYVSPDNNTIAIRLGRKWGVMDWWPTILYKLINSST